MKKEYFSVVMLILLLSVVSAIGCTLDTQCKTNEFCSRNTWTCELSSDTDIGVEGEDREVDCTDDSACSTGWHCDTKLWKCIQGETPVPGSGPVNYVDIETSSNNVSIIIGSIIISIAVILGFIILAKKKHKEVQ